MKNDEFIYELYLLENLMPNYKEELRMISIDIRNKILPISDRDKLVYILKVLNKAMKCYVETLGEDHCFVLWYVHFLEKYAYLYAIKKYECECLCQKMEKKFRDYMLEKLILQQWKYINLYFNEDIFFEKNIIEILDDMLKTIDAVCPDKFYINAGTLSKLIHGRKGVWNKAIDIEPPTIEVAKEKKIINRWNPPDKRYLYLVIDNGNSQNANKVCINELRATDGMNVTICNFEVNGYSKSGRLINLDYESISYEEIEEILKESKDKLINECMSKIDIYDSDNKSIIKSINKVMHENKKQIEMKVNEYCGKYILKKICDTIFVPLDRDEDNNEVLKDKCYKSFHILAEYFESKDIAGIIYPSTRMKIIGEKGTNLVLFDADSAKPDIDTLIVVKV
ncbi:MAG: hypothetical protein EGQ35_08265 [Clostridiales bacterium]|nr:hypothetical protein [Clostridiales bacterium]